MDDATSIVHESAAAVADDMDVDWDARASAHPSAAPRLEKLKVIASLARAFRAARGPLPSGSGPEECVSDAGPLAGTAWSHLRLRSKLGEGSFGEVYRAHDPMLDRDVALKLSKARWSGEGERRYLEEARRLAKVRHPNVVVVHGAEILDGRVGLWTDLVEGDTLEQLLARGGPLDAREAALIGADVCRALGAVHAQGLVHGDVKASNVMRERGGRIVLMDFGTVKEFAPDGGAIVTRGTPMVLAPELLRGGAPTPAADLYSLGVLLYQLVSGRYPVEGANVVEILTQHAAGPVRPLRDMRPGLPGLFTRVVEQALDADPRRRPPSADDMERMLSDAAAAPAATGSHGRRRLAVAAALAGVAIAVAGALLPLRGGRSALPPRPSVAVLGFKNLSGRADTAWLSTALSEMLSTELAAGERLRTVPGAQVARMKAELTLGEADALSGETLRRVRRNVGADFVALGSYLSVEGPPRQLRLDVRLQDAGTGTTVVSLSEQGSEAQIFDIVARTGARLRARLGAVASPDTGRLRASMPAHPQAARWYAEGLARLRVFDAREARLLLEKAVAAEPDFAPGHSALASAWATLGYDASALEEAKRAFELASGLPREDALAVEGLYREAAREWERAIDVYRSLATMHPDDLEYGLRLAQVQTAAARGQDALATLDALRRLPPPASDDPRIDLAEADAAETVGADRRSQAAAARAAEKGGASGARLVVARARLEQGIAWFKLSELDAASAAIEESRVLFAEMGDTLGVARALNQAANILRERGDLNGARTVFERALAACREVGWATGVGAALNNIGLVLNDQGDLAGAEAMFRQALAVDRETRNPRQQAARLNNLAVALRMQGQLKTAISMHEEALAIHRRTGNKRGQAMQLNNIANIVSDQGDLARAQRLYEESLAMARELGDRRGIGILLHNLGDMRSLRGDPGQAQALLEEALAARRAVGDRGREALTLDLLGRVLMARADLPGARRLMEEALAIHREVGDKGSQDPRVSLAELALEEGRPQETERDLEDAAREFQKQGRPNEEAAALVVLARAAAASGQREASNAAIDRALAISARQESRALRILVAVEAARLRLGRDSQPCPPDARASLRSLEAAARDAAAAGLDALELQARLGLGEADLACGRAAAGRARLAALEKAARSRGLTLLADKAAALRNR